MTAIVAGGARIKSHTLIGRGKFSNRGTLSIRIPQDIVVKEFILKVKGHIAATYAGAKPKVRPYGVLDGLFAKLEVSRKGTDRVRSYLGVRHLVTTNERMFGQMEGDLYKINSTNLSGNHAQGNLDFGTNGQNTALCASISIPMESKMTGAWHPTLFNTKGLQTATLNIAFGNLADIQDPEDDAVATFAGDLEVEVYASCCDFELDNVNIGRLDWNQNFEELEFAGVQKDNRHRITPQGLLQGILISGYHSGDKPFDMEHMENTRVEVRYLGTQIAEGSLLSYLEIDKHKTMLHNNKKGSCYLSFLHHSEFGSGVPIADGKQLELIISTPLNGEISYSTPIRLRFEYDQLTQNPYAPKTA